MSFNLKFKLKPRHKRAMQSGLREAAKLTAAGIGAVTGAFVFLGGVFLIATHGSPLLALIFVFLCFFLFCWISATYDAMRREQEEEENNYEYYLR